MHAERDNAYAQCTHRDTDREALARRQTFGGRTAPFTLHAPFHFPFHVAHFPF